MARGKRNDGQPRKKRERPAAVAAGVTHNLTIETVSECMLNILLARGAVERNQFEGRQLNGIYRKEIQRAQKLGLDTDPITHYIKYRHKPVDDVNRMYSQINLIAQAMKWPIGTVPGIKADGTTIAAAVDQEQMAEQAVEEVDGDTAYRQGWAASEAGKSFDSCPYTPDTLQQIKWLSGWDDHQFKLASNFQPTEPQPAGIDPPLDMGNARPADALDEMGDAGERQVEETTEPLPF